MFTKNEFYKLDEIAKFKDPIKKIVELNKILYRIFRGAYYIDDRRLFIKTYDKNFVSDLNQDAKFIEAKIKEEIEHPFSSVEAKFFKKAWNSYSKCSENSLIPFLYEFLNTKIPGKSLELQNKILIKIYGSDNHLELYGGKYINYDEQLRLHPEYIEDLPGGAGLSADEVDYFFRLAAGNFGEKVLLLHYIDDESYLKADYEIIGNRFSVIRSGKLSDVSLIKEILSYISPNAKKHFFKGVFDNQDPRNHFGDISNFDFNHPSDKFKKDEYKDFLNYLNHKRKKYL